MIMRTVKWVAASTPHANSQQKLHGQHVAIAEINCDITSPDIRSHEYIVLKK